MGPTTEECISSRARRSRMSVVHLAGGRQPMSNEDGTLWITFDGKIFN